MSVFPSNIIPIFVLLCFTILFHIPNITADEDSLLEECLDDNPYESGSPFETNLNHLLDSLVTGGSSDGYFNTSEGVGSDIVYGLAQCRGDLTMEHCEACLKAAKDGITESCSYGMSATLRYERCMIRYSDTIFFSEKSTTSSWSKYDTNVTEEYFEGFSTKLDTLLQNLTTNAGSTPKRYSSDKIEYVQFELLYAVVQCTRDLSPSDCEGCLELLSSSIPICCNASEGATIASDTCYIRYQTEKFVDGSPPSSSPESPRSTNQTFSPPSPNERPKPKTSNGNDGGKSFNVLFIIVAIIASIVLQ